MKEINDFLAFVKSDLENQNIPSKLNEIVRKKTSTAGKSPEGVFTREFLCPTIYKYFSTHIRENLSLKDCEIQSGLGTEGPQHTPGFGFTPIRQRKHIFTKSDIVKPNPPQSWFDEPSKEPTNYQACPDFSIRTPLPFSALGEVKYFRKGNIDTAMREFYNDVRQVSFYLGAFRQEYESGILIIADETPDRISEKSGSRTEMINRKRKYIPKTKNEVLDELKQRDKFTVLLNIVVINSTSAGLNPLGSINPCGLFFTYLYRFVSPPLNPIGSFEMNLPISWL